MGKLSLQEPMHPPKPNPNMLAKKARKVPSCSVMATGPCHSKSTLPSPSPSPTRPNSPKRKGIKPFLTKECSVTAFDSESRMQNFEEMFGAFYNKISEANQSSDVMKDAVNLYKSRGMFTLAE